MNCPDLDKCAKQKKYCLCTKDTKCVETDKETRREKNQKRLMRGRQVQVLMKGEKDDKAQTKEKFEKIAKAKYQSVDQACTGKKWCERNQKCLAPLKMTKKSLLGAQHAAYLAINKRYIKGTKDLDASMVSSERHAKQAALYKGDVFVISEREVGKVFHYKDSLGYFQGWQQGRRGSIGAKFSGISVSRNNLWLVGRYGHNDAERAVYNIYTPHQLFLSEQCWEGGYSNPKRQTYGLNCNTQRKAISIFNPHGIEKGHRGTKNMEVSASGDNVWAWDDAGNVFYYDASHGLQGNFTLVKDAPKLKQVSVSGSIVWGVDKTGRVHHNEGKSGNWATISGRAMKQVSVAGDIVWAIDDPGNVYYRKGAAAGSWTPAKDDYDIWTFCGGNRWPLKHECVFNGTRTVRYGGPSSLWPRWPGKKDPPQTKYVMKTVNAGYAYGITCKPETFGLPKLKKGSLRWWEKKMCEINYRNHIKLKQISAAGEHVWGVDHDNRIFYRNGVSGKWENIPGFADSISVSDRNSKQNAQGVVETENDEVLEQVKSESSAKSGPNNKGITIGWDKKLWPEWQEERKEKQKKVAEEMGKKAAVVKSERKQKQEDKATRAKQQAKEKKEKVKFTDDCMKYKGKAQNYCQYWLNYDDASWAYNKAGSVASPAPPFTKDASPVAGTLKPYKPCVGPCAKAYKEISDAYYPPPPNSTVDNSVKKLFLSLGPSLIAESMETSNVAIPADVSKLQTRINKLSDTACKRMFLNYLAQCDDKCKQADSCYFKCFWEMYDQHRGHDVELASCYEKHLGIYHEGHAIGHLSKQQQQNEKQEAAVASASRST